MKRMALFGLMVLLLATPFLYFTTLRDFFTFEHVRDHRIEKIIREYPWATLLLFTLLYMVSTLLSLPLGAFLSIMGGYLFSQPWGLLAVVIGATTGATLLFIAAKTLLREYVYGMARGWLFRMEEGFREHRISYLLFLRLFPAFPFWLVNVAPAFFNVPLHLYVLTTFFGIMPGAFLFTEAGRGLADSFNHEEGWSIDGFFSPKMRLIFFGLALFMLLPALIKGRVKKNESLIHEEGEKRRERE